MKEKIKYFTLVIIGMLSSSCFFGQDISIKSDSVKVGIYSESISNHRDVNVRINKSPMDSLIGSKLLPNQIMFTHDFERVYVRELELINNRKK